MKVPCIMALVTSRGLSHSLGAFLVEIKPPLTGVLYGGDEEADPCIGRCLHTSTSFYWMTGITREGILHPRLTLVTLTSLEVPIDYHERHSYPVLW